MKRGVDEKDVFRRNVKKAPEGAFSSCGGSDQSRLVNPNKLNKLLKMLNKLM